MQPNSIQSIEAVDDLLHNRRSLTKLEQSSWANSCLVAHYRMAHPDQSRAQALKEVLNAVLAILKRENEEYASLLFLRFWKGRSVTALASDSSLRLPAERTIYNFQKEAIREFTHLLVERERACLAEEEGTQNSPQDVAPMPEEGTTNQAEQSNYFPNNFNTPAAVEVLKTEVVEEQPARSSVRADSPTTQPSKARSSRRIAIAAAAGLSAIVLLSLIFLGGFSNKLNTSVDNLPVPLLFNSPSPSSSICGEPKRSQAPDATYFLRSQGVSAFTPDNTGKLVVSEKVRALAIDERGLWIGYYATDRTPQSGLGYYDKKTWAMCDLPTGAQGQNVNALAIDKEHRVWVGLEKGGVAMLDGQTWYLYTTDEGLPSNEIFGLTVDNAGSIWASTWEGVAKFNGRRWDTIYTVEGGTIANNHVHTVAFPSNGDKWFGHMGKGVSRYEAATGKWLNYVTGSSQLTGDHAHSITVRPPTATSNEQIWIATTDGGIDVIENNNWKSYRVADGLPSDNVQYITVDPLGRVWAATTGGVAYFDGKRWITYDTLDTFAIAFGPRCESCPLDNDQVWTGTATQGLTQSRLPYDTPAIDVLSLDYPRLVAPGQSFNPKITISPRSPYTLTEKWGDFLANTDSDDVHLFGAFEHIAVKGTVESGQRYTFVDYDNPFIAPQLPSGVATAVFTSTWRMWMHTRYAGPPIPIVFTVTKSLTPMTTP